MVDALSSFTPREFEEAVAHIFQWAGYDVNVTSATRDGVVDIFAERLNSLDLPDQWIVECKYYREDRAVGVETVRALAGVREFLKARNAVIVASSRFTTDARVLAEALRLELVDRAKLLRWMRLKEAHAEPTSTPSKRFESVFISHSHRDLEFVTRLNGALRRRGVRTWFSEEDLEAGTKIHESVFSAIDSFDRLIIVLSRDSLKSQWVQTEMHRALRKQRETGKSVLFPVSTIPFEELRNWSCFDPDSGKDLGVELREYLIPTISDTSNDDEFSRFVDAIVQGL